MIPPAAPATLDEERRPLPGDSVRLDGLRKRADFLALNRARRQATATMIVQARPREDGSPLVRVGFTCSKKLGNAVLRNRAKRRLRAAAREILATCARPGWDYALIGRPGTTATAPFERIRADLRHALEKCHPPA